MNFNPNAIILPQYHFYVSVSLISDEVLDKIFIGYSQEMKFRFEEYNNSKLR